MGSTKGRLEKELLERENELMQAKTEAINTQKRIEELYSEAIAAVGSYRSGSDE
jgi:hypothetical protein